MPDTLTGHDLLIRIDERQGVMAKQMTELCGKVNKKVDDDKEYQAVLKKVDNLWDMKNRMIGWMVGAGAAGGTLVTIVKGVAEKVLAR